MLGSDVLDIAIGMVFVYFLLSLLCVTLAELIARIFALRSSTLYAAIRNLLADPKINSDLLDKFWKHPVISTLARDDAGLGIGVGRNKPSYIPANLFALALLDVIAERGGSGGPPKTPDEVGSAVNALADEKLRKLLLAVIGLDGSRQQMQQELAVWFDQYMERVSGWYRRKAQAINLVLAVVLVIMLNADSLAIFNALSANPKLRAAAVDVAIDRVKGQSSPAPTATPPATDTQGAVDLVEPVTQILSLQDTLAKLNLPITWAPADEKVPKDVTGWFYRVLGLLITALLVSLGAPFWFDLLNRLVNLRATGQVPAKVTDGSGGETTPPGVPAVTQPSGPPVDVEDLADRAVQSVDAFRAAGNLLTRDQERKMAIQFVTQEVARRGWVSTPTRISTAVEAAFQRRRGS